MNGAFYESKIFGLALNTTHPHFDRDAAIPAAALNRRRG